MLPPLSALKHNLLILSYDRIRTFHPQTGLDVVIRFPLIYSQLLSSISQTIHSHMFIKPLFICPVLTFYFPIMPWRCYLYPVIQDSQFHECLLYFLTRIVCSSIRFQLSFLFLLFRWFQILQPGCNPFEASITACIAIDLCQLLIRQE